MNEKEINEIAEIANDIGNIVTDEAIGKLEALSYTSQEIKSALKAMQEMRFTVSYLHGSLYGLITDLEMQPKERILTQKE